jgi:hypothetical protein
MRQESHWPQSSTINGIEEKRAEIGRIRGFPSKCFGLSIRLLRWPALPGARHAAATNRAERLTVIVNWPALLKFTVHLGGLDRPYRPS